MTKAITKASSTKATAIAAVASTNTAAEVITKQPEVQAAPVTEAPAAAVTIVAAISKAQVANGIFKEMYAMPQVPARKDMIKRVMAEAGLTEKGAATYLQNYKSKNGLVVKKEAATA